MVRVTHGPASLSVIHGSAFRLVKSRPADETDLSAVVPYVVPACVCVTGVLPGAVWRVWGRPVYPRLFTPGWRAPKVASVSLRNGLLDLN